MSKITHKSHKPLLLLRLQEPACGGQQLGVPAQGLASEAQQQAGTATPGSGWVPVVPSTADAVPGTRFSQGFAAGAGTAPSAACPGLFKFKLPGRTGSHSLVNNDHGEGAPMAPSSNAAAGRGAEQPAGQSPAGSAQASTVAPAAEQAGSPSLVINDHGEAAPMAPSSHAAAGRGAEQPAGQNPAGSAQASTLAPAAEQAGSPSLVINDHGEAAPMAPSSNAAAGRGAEQPAGQNPAGSAQATTSVPAAEQAGSSSGVVKLVCALTNKGKQPALAAAAAAAGQAAPVRDPSVPVQGGAEPAEADSANQQQPPVMADCASADPSDALAAAPAARVGKGSSAEFQEGAHSGTQGPAMACSVPCSGLPAATQGGAPSAASAAGATQSSVPVAQGSKEADADNETTTTASKVSNWHRLKFASLLGTQPCTAACLASGPGLLCGHPIQFCRSIEFQHLVGKTTGQRACTANFREPAVQRFASLWSDWLQD